MAWLEFVDEQHVLTSNFDYQSVLWKLPECQPVYVLKNAQPIALSPGGKYVAFWRTNEDGDRLALCEALTGECRGTAEGGGLENPLGAFRGDGLILAAAHLKQLGMWDLQSGRFCDQIELSEYLGGSLRWMDGRYLLAGDKNLVDSIMRAVVWKYETTDVSVAPDSGDGKLWFVANDPNDQIPGFFLHALPIPGNNVRLATAGMTSQDLLILGRGGRASITVSAQIEGVDNNQLMQAIAKNLVANGVTVDNSAPVRVVLTGSITDGQTQTYQSELLKFRTIQVTEKVLSASLSVTDAKGRKWEITRDYTSKGNFRETGDIQEKITSHCRLQFEAFAKGNLIPPEIYPEVRFNDRNRSRITLRGELPPN